MAHFIYDQHERAVHGFVLLSVICVVVVQGGHVLSSFSFSHFVMFLINFALHV